MKMFGKMVKIRSILAVFAGGITLSLGVVFFGCCFLWGGGGLFFGGRLCGVPSDILSSSGILKWGI